MSEGEIAAVSAGAVTVLGALGMGVAWIYSRWSARRRTTMKEIWKLVDECRASCKLQGMHIEQLQETVGEQDVMLARQEGITDRLQDWVQLAWADAKARGSTIPPPPKLPPPAARKREKEHREYMTRTTAENTELLKKTAPPCAPDGGGGI